MVPYWSDERGRYGTGESYDWFQKYPDGVETFESEDGLWTCTEVEGGVEILRYNGNATDIIVPSIIAGKPVIMLNSTFDGFVELKSVVIPEGVINIEGAFYGCEGLEKVSLPDSIVEMDWAFNSCYSLKDIKLPAGVKDVSWALQFVNIRHIELPQGVEHAASVMSGTESIESVFVPKSVKCLHEAFADCENLKEVVLEDGLSKIDKYAFYHCTNLRELIIPESVVEIEPKSVGIMEIREYIDPDKMAYRMKGEQVVPGFVIKGVSGSAAEKYAHENGIPFVVVD
ncbi:MAG: leucine-rich repeat domain-containing protein [Lachnospiraceae bacterium]|nr:leucine-rich repeat domain-containing protein [Lachnospiraceae bacterium]